MPIPVLQMLMMAAKSGMQWVVLVGNITESSVNAANGPCSAGVRVNTNGQLETGFSNSSASPTYSNVTSEWALPLSGDPGNEYHVQMVYISGAHLDVGTEDTWLALTSQREFNVNASAGPKTGTFVGTLEISHDGGATVADSGSVSLTENSFQI